MGNMNQMAVTNEQMEKKLRDAGLRPSSVRIRVMRYLEENRNHPNVNQIYGALLPELPGLSRASIYNSLTALHNLHLVRYLTIDGDELRFDACVEDHGHFCCESCSMVYDFPFAQPDFEQSLSGFRINRQDYFLWGVCPNCLANASTQQTQFNTSKNI